MAKPGGNKPGGNKPKGGNRPRGNWLNQQAVSNVQLQDQGQADLLHQQFQQAQQDFQRERQGTRSIYGGYQDQLANIPKPQFGQIGNQYDAALASISPMFGGDQYQPQGEQDAGNALGLATGEAGHTMLANLAAREGMSRSSAGREGALAGRYAQDSQLQNFQDTMQGYNNNLGQLRADDPWQIQNEMTRLKEQQMTQQLAKARMASDQATSDFLQQYYGSLASGGNRGPGGNRHGGRPNGGRQRPASAGPRHPNYGSRTPPQPGMEPTGQTMTQAPINYYYPAGGYDYSQGSASGGYDLGLNTNSSGGAYDLQTGSSPYDDYLSQLLGSQQ